MQALKYLIMGLILLNLPSTFFFEVSPSFGSLLSYLSYGLLLLFYILNNGGKPNAWILLIGLSYYLISGVNFYSGEEPKYFTNLFKFIILAFAGNTLVKKISTNELFTFLILGAISVILEASFFPTEYGRYAGFYTNPNMGGFIALMAFCLTFKIKNFYSKSFLQIISTAAGIITFSRTFLVLWILINLLSIGISLKNIRILGVGFGLIILLTLVGPSLDLNTTRLDNLISVLNKEQGAIQNASEGSRTETWAVYYDYVLEKPIFGNGYGAFHGRGLKRVGSHNAYLLIIGESGIIPFFMFVGLSLYFIFMGLKLFRQSPYLLMYSIAFSLFMLTNDNFFETEFVVILALWIYAQIGLEIKNRDNSNLEYQNEGIYLVE